MPSVGTLTQCVYYFSSDPQAFNIDPMVTMACQVIIYASCHKAKTASLEMNRTLEQKAPGMFQMTE